MAIKPKPINPYVAEYLNTFRDLSAAGKNLNPLFATDMGIARQRKQEYEDFLGKTDYSGKLKESEDLAKLQLGLALAQRGFAAMGAQPRRGESPIGVLGRTLAAPLAGDLSTVAGRLMQQRQAVKLAEQQEERRLKLSALTAAASEGKERRALVEKLLKDGTGKSSDFNRNLKTNVTAVLTDGTEIPGANIVTNISKTSGKAFYTLAGQQEVGGKVYKPTTPVVSFKTTSKSASGAIETKRFAVEYGSWPGDLDAENQANAFEKSGLDPNSANLFSRINSGQFKGQYVQDVSGKIMPKNWYLAPNLEEIKDDSGDKDQLSFANVGVFRKYNKGPDGKPVLGSELFHVTRKNVNGVTSLVLSDSDKKIKQGTKIGQYQLVDKTKATGESDQQLRRKERENAVLNSMSYYQYLPVGGAFSKDSALYFDQGAFLQNKSPWKFIPRGTNARDRSKDVTITNPLVLKLIKNKVTAAAQEILRNDYGSANQEIKTKRLADAVKSILGSSAETLLGTSPITEIGTRGGQTVGYSPSPAAFDSTSVNQNVRTAMTALRQPDNQDIDAAASLSGLPYPRNNRDLNKPWGRAKAASELFPSAFEIISPDDVGMIQRRYDIEKVLPNVRLVAGADSTDHRALIQKAVVKKAEARKKLQNSVDARLAKENFGPAQEFRRALIEFKNAAAETGVEGFFTGRFAGTLARVGFADFIAGDGAEHWNRLTVASDRFQNGISRRVGRDFGDNRISNYDAEAYKKLVADIKKGKKFNRVLIEDGLKRVLRDMTSLMSYGGKVGWTERELKQAAEAGVNFSELKTMEDWHGHGYYGENRYSTTRQQSPALSQDDRNNIRTQGQLKDSMYGNKYTTPTVNYSTDRLPTFRLPGDRNPTPIKRFDSFEFDQYIENQARIAGVDEEVMRKRVLRGILNYNVLRDQVR